MRQIKVGDYVIDVVKKDIKNLHLGVYPPDGRIRIAAPFRVDDEAVRLMAISKIPWIKKQVSRFHKQERQSARKYVSGESHYYKGDRYLLNVIYHNNPAKVVIRNKTYIDLYVRESSDLVQRRRVMTEWYRKQLKILISPLIEKWQPIIGVEVHDWSVKQMRTKWGSCNIISRRIWLNLELAKKPERLVEYIVIHEMVHLLERKHNDRYMAYIDKFMPQWRSYKEELNSLVL